VGHGACDGEAGDAFVNRHGGAVGLRFLGCLDLEDSRRDVVAFGDSGVEHGLEYAVDVAGPASCVAAGLVDCAHVGGGELVEASVTDGGDDPVPNRVGGCVVCLGGEVTYAHLEVGASPRLDRHAAGLYVSAFLGGDGVTEFALHLPRCLRTDGGSAPRAVRVPAGLI
jgi:hypothetical protein